MRDRTTKDQRLDDYIEGAQGGAKRRTRQMPTEATERLEGRFKTGRRYNILNIMGNESVKELLDHAAQQEDCRPQDIVRRYLLVTLEDKYGDDIPYTA